jgi:hypothetical protein
MYKNLQNVLKNRNLSQPFFQKDQKIYLVGVLAQLTNLMAENILKNV